MTVASKSATALRRDTASRHHGAAARRPHATAHGVPAMEAAAADGRVRVLRPSGPLAAYVDHYWLVGHSSGSTTTLRPDGRVDVVLARHGRDTTVSAYGTVTTPTELTLAAGATYVGIQFRPAQARHFLAVAAHELTDRALPGLDVLTFACDRALDGAGPRAILAALETALLQRLARSPPRVARIYGLVASVEAAYGSLRVQDLAARAGVSRRQVEREFLDAVGVAPKVFASILRFEHAAARLRAGRAIVDTALAAGYADQSHLHLAFRRYAALTPARYARGDVAFFQDAKPMLDHDDGGS